MTDGVLVKYCGRRAVRRRGRGTATLRATDCLDAQVEDGHGRVGSRGIWAVLRAHSAAVGSASLSYFRPRSGDPTRFPSPPTVGDGNRPREHGVRVALAPQRRNRRDPQGAPVRRQPGVSGRGRKTRALAARKRSLHKCALGAECCRETWWHGDVAAVSERGGSGLGSYARRRPLEVSPVSSCANAIDCRSASMHSVALNDQAAPTIGLVSARRLIG